MSDVQKIAKNSFFVTAGTILIRLIGVIVIAIIAREFGQEGYGIYTLAISYWGVMSLVANFGVGTILVRDFAESKDKNKLFNTAVTTRFVLSFLSFILLFFALKVMGYSDNIIICTLILVSSIFLLSILQSSYAVFQSQLRMEIYTLLEFVNRILSTIMIFFVGVFKLDILFVFVSLTISWGVSALLSLKFVDVKLKIETEDIKKMLKEAWPIGLADTISTFIGRISVFLLSIMINVKEVALYGCAYTLTEVFYLLPNSLVMPLFPVLSSFHQQKNYDMLKRSFRLAQKYMFMASFPIAAGVAIFSKQAIELVYGEKFLAASPLLLLYSLSSIFGFSALIIGSVMVAIGKQRENLKVMLISVVLNFPLAYALITPFGALGATAAYLICSTFYWAMMMHLAVKNDLAKPFDFINLSYKPFLATIVMLFASIWAMKIHWIVGMAMGAASYGITLVILGGIEKEDWDILRKVIKR